MAALDQNQNQNQTIGSSIASGAERRFRPRYNTDLFPMLAASAGGMVVPDPPYPSFHPNWDAELRACMFLDEFLKNAIVVTAPGWRNRYKTAATTLPLMQPQNMGKNDLNAQVMQMLQLALEREDRFAEIIDQDDGDGAINYWQGMLKVDPARHPNTYLMLRIGRRIGERTCRDVLERGVPLPSAIAAKSVNCPDDRPAGDALFPGRPCRSGLSDVLSARV